MKKWSALTLFNIRFERQNHCNNGFSNTRGQHLPNRMQDAHWFVASIQKVQTTNQIKGNGSIVPFIQTKDSERYMIQNDLFQRK